MLKFCSLFSGSSGNSLFVQSDQSKILIDCGASGKKICNALASINSSIEDIDAILITHEHSDHVQSLGLLSKKYNIPVYINKETFNALSSSQKEKISPENINYFINDKEFFFNDLTIKPFSIPHDAANPCGYNIHNGKRKISIATDLGHVNNDILENLKNSSFILLESNYDPEILHVSKYPYSLKERIKGPNGHLSNETAGKLISALSNNELKEVMLGHLSKENNFPELAYQTVAEELMKNNIDLNNLKLSVANRYEPSKIIDL